MVFFQELQTTIDNSQTKKDYWVKKHFYGARVTRLFAHHSDELVNNNPTLNTPWNKVNAPSVSQNMEETTKNTDTKLYVHGVRDQDWNGISGSDTTTRCHVIPSIIGQISYDVGYALFYAVKLVPNILIALCHEVKALTVTDAAQQMQINICNHRMIEAILCPYFILSIVIDIMREIFSLISREYATQMNKKNMNIENCNQLH